MTNTASPELLVTTETKAALGLFRGIATSTWLRAVGVAIAYYCGGQIDAILGWSGSPGVLWPPNAVLLASLLLVGRRTWWVYVLAVLPADRAISWNSPLLTGLSLFLSNTVQTLLAASLIRLGGRVVAPKWDDPIFVLRFIFVGAFLGPCIGGVLGGLTLHWFHPDESFWILWRGWWIANALTILTFVPLLTMTVQLLDAALWHSARFGFVPRFEALLLFGVLIGVATTVFEVRWVPGEELAPLLYAPLPFLLWAALRFGPCSASAAQLVLVFIAIHGAANGRGPFLSGAAASNVFQLQILLVAMSSSLLLLSAIHLKELEERRALLAANADTRRLEHRLGQVARLATAGEIAAAVTHEVFQPLSAVLINAECAKRSLALQPPDLVELRATLNDIAADSKRATEAGRRLRALLKNGELERKPVELNDLIRQVARLVNVDVATRSISLSLELDPYLPIVSGDCVQLQQVVLNLIINGFAAVRQGTPDDGKLVVRTRTGSCQTVEVTVCDNGTGIETGLLGRIFEPFYTTKAEGLGIGLSISRTIVEAHGGSIEAYNNADHGATFKFTLPESVK